MTHTIDAIYDNGTLRLAHPLPLSPNEKVRVTIVSAYAPEAASPILELRGALQWTGTQEDLHRLAEDPGFDVQETA